MSVSVAVDRPWRAARERRRHGSHHRRVPTPQVRGTPLALV